MVKTRRKNNLKKRKKAIISIFTILFLFLLYMSTKITYSPKNKSVASVTPTSTVISDNKKIETNRNVEILLSSAGDCTIGTDPSFDRSTSLPTIVRDRNNDYSYLFKNSAPIFQKDDITIVNLETTFTNATERAEKTFTFKAPPEFSKALILGSIEGVNISNNHTRDYLDKGFTDTISTLKQNNINYFGENNKWIKEINGVKLGFLGYTGWQYNDRLIDKLKKDIEELKAENCVVIINFHWGEENSYYPNSTQKSIAHYAVDQGADLVIGHHPHVVQGIEKYKDKIICYSLGNFCFGGNSNPRDKDTFVLQAKFSFNNNNLEKYSVRAIPFSISSVNYKNDYCPTPLEGDSKERVLKKINNLSSPLGFQVSDSFD
ncbi:CapA family protein [Clostridium magnum]|uniref:Capsule biosynthesis protein CapA n=1 Tax=Clostridium magnum DSM 2767 TaxID=1121326 RepID=A0A162T1C4_9CLOT|nr:CapA family protein [Clostridium magnum]KZL92123.1 capsule biosynthesis protein CapA [Clostridium magnum DSM 2767]SHH21473.1 poly-gamma-glutamate synthesis protein (capsule biosynthesis protein) [Clostridium magnum DSM 2767]